MATETEIFALLKRRLPELLPALDVEVKRPRREEPWDLALKVWAVGTTRWVICEVKSLGEPRYLAQAIATLIRTTQKDPRLYPLVVASYISSERQRLCREQE